MTTASSDWQKIILALIACISIHSILSTIRYSVEITPATPEQSSFDGTCLWVHFRMDMSGYTANYSRVAIRWLKQGPFQSLHHQLLLHRKWPAHWSVVVVVHGYEKHAALIESELIPTQNSLPFNLIITRRQLNESAMVDNGRCQWMVRVRLDADDLLAPGYLNYLQNEVIQKQSKHWFGAVVLARAVQMRVQGKGLCGQRWKVDQPFYSGYSMGQTIIMPRRFWINTGRQMFGCQHTECVQVYRDLVANRVLGMFDYHSLSGSAHGGHELFDAAYDAKDEPMTRVRAIDISSQFKHVYMINPLSGHFPWKLVKTNGSARCSTRPDDDSIWDGLSEGDAAQSNKRFIRSQSEVDAYRYQEFLRL
jgi:hypothetical protein